MCPTGMYPNTICRACLTSGEQPWALEKEMDKRHNTISPPEADQTKASMSTSSSHTH